MLEPFAFPRHTGPPQCERHSVSDCPRARQCPSVNESCPLVFDDGRPEPKVSTHLAITHPTWALTDTGFLRHPRERHCSWKTFGSFLVFFLRTLPINITHFPAPHPFSHHLLPWKPSAHPVLSTPVFLNILFQVSDALKKRVVVGRWDLD